MTGETFTFAEIRIMLTAFAMWHAEKQGVTLLAPAALVDQFIEETT